MTARSTIRTTAIACAFLSATSMMAQEKIPPPLAPAEDKTAVKEAEKRAVRQQADAALMLRLQRAEQEQALLQQVAADQKRAAARLAVQRAKLQRDEAVRAMQRKQEVQQIMMADLIIQRAMVQLNDDPIHPGRQLTLRESLDRTVNSMAFGAVDPASARTTFTRYLDTDLATRRHTMRLTPDQESRLRLAAEGDMKRFFDDVATLREKFAAAIHDPARKKELLRDVQRLRALSQASPFGEGSLYAKVLEKIRHDWEVVKKVPQ